MAWRRVNEWFLPFQSESELMWNRIRLWICNGKVREGRGYDSLIFVSSLIQSQVFFSFFFSVHSKNNFNFGMAILWAASGDWRSCVTYVVCDVLQFRISFKYMRHRPIHPCAVHMWNGNAINQIELRHAVLYLFRISAATEATHTLAPSRIQSVKF